MNRSTNESSQMLEKKRKRRDSQDKISRNYQTEEAACRSENINDTFSKIFSFDWEDQKLEGIKINPFDNFNANAFLFNVNSSYFPTDNEEKYKEGIISFFRNEMSPNQLEQEWNDGDQDDSQADPDFLRDLMYFASDGKNAEELKDISNYKRTNRKGEFLTDDVEHTMESILRRIREKNEVLIREMKFKDSKIDFNWLEDKKNYNDFLKNKHEDFKNRIKRRKIITKFKDEMDYLNDVDRTANLVTEQDTNCMICNDGNTLHLDLDIICAHCGISVHLSCYGVTNRTVGEDWYCDLCSVYPLEEAQELSCILCSVKGGAMKQSDIKYNSNFYKNILRLRRLNQLINNNEIISDKSCSGTGGSNSNKTRSERRKSKKIMFPENIISDSNTRRISLLQNISITNSHLKLNYDKIANCCLNDTKQFQYPLQNSYDSTKSTSHPVNDDENSSIKSYIGEMEFSPNRSKRTKGNAWIHLSCAMWTQEVIFTKNKKEIRNIEAIPEERFKEICLICNIYNYGPVLTCAESGCGFKFHVECARINHYCMEITEGSLRREKLRYNIYCHDHRQNKILERIRLIKSREEEDIKNFAKVLQKVLKLTAKSDCSGENCKKNLQSSFTFNSPKSNSKFELTKKEKSEFITRIRHLCKLFSNYKKIIITKKSKNLRLKNIDLYDNTSTHVQNMLNENFHIKYEFDKESFCNRLNYEDIIESKNFPWYMLKLRNFNKEKIKNTFVYLISNETEYKMIFFGNKKDSPKLSKNIDKDECENKSKENVINNQENIVSIPKHIIEEDDTLYCICNGNYLDGDLMISKTIFNRFKLDCLSEDNCVGAYQGWYHKNCIDELAKKRDEELTKENFSYICEKCRLNR